MSPAALEVGKYALAARPAGLVSLRLDASGFWEKTSAAKSASSRGEIEMKAPDERTLQLVKNVAPAFEEYHGERRGNWSPVGGLFFAAKLGTHSSLRTASRRRCSSSSQNCATAAANERHYPFLSSSLGWT